jgi:plastocyanin
VLFGAAATMRTEALVYAAVAIAVTGVVLLLRRRRLLPALVAGVATVREERRRRRHGDVSVLRTPGWLVPLVASVVAASAGAIAVSGVVRAGDVRADGERTGLSPRTLAALPSVVAEHHAFAQRELHARAGQPVVLRVDNRDGVRHSFDVDAFDVHVSLPGRASTLVVFMAGRAGRYTVYCAPHFDRASGRGMRTTLVVAP